MKYLLFNVIVVAALVYLFVGGGPTDPVEAWLPENVNTVISDVRERLSALPGDENRATTEPMAKISAPAAPAVQPEGMVTTLRPAPAAAIPAPLPSRAPAATAETLPAAVGPTASGTAPSINVPERLTPPAILPPAGESSETAQSRAGAATLQVEGPLMSARERRRELQRLAEAMELFAVEKISR